MKPSKKLNINKRKEMYGKYIEQRTNPKQKGFEKFLTKTNKQNENN